MVALAVTVGIGLTVIDLTAVLVHPNAEVEVKVYVPVTVGENATPFVIPPVQVYVDAPPPVNVVLPPKQITEFVTATINVGFGLMVIVYDLGV